MKYLNKISLLKNRHYISTYVTEFVVLIATIIVYKEAAVYLSKSGFSEYSLCRRIISFLIPFVLLGIGVGLSRYVAIAESSKSNLDSIGYLFSGLIIVLIFSSFIFSLVILFSDSFSFLLFGQKSYSYLILPLCVYSWGLMLHGFIYAYYRGKFQMIRANILQLFNMVLVPVLVFLFSHSLTQVLYLTGLTTMIISLFPVCVILYQNFKYILFYKIKLYTTELLRYSIPRMPGDIGLSLFLMLPPLFSSHYSTVEEAGNVAFGMTLLNMICASLSPVSIVLLPEATKLITQNQIIKLKNKTYKFLYLTIFSIILFVVGIELFIPYILKIYLGEQYVNMANIIRLIFLASLGYGVYVMLRSIIDAYYIKSINAMNILFSLIIFFTFFFGLKFYVSEVYAMISSFVFSFSFLGFMSYYYVHSIFKKNNQLTI